MNIVKYYCSASLLAILLNTSMPTSIGFYNEGNAEEIPMHGHFCKIVKVSDSHRRDEKLRISHFLINSAGRVNSNRSWTEIWSPGSISY